MLPVLPRMDILMRLPRIVRIRKAQPVLVTLLRRFHEMPSYKAYKSGRAEALWCCDLDTPSNDYFWHAELVKLSTQAFSS